MKVNAYLTSGAELKPQKLKIQNYDCFGENWVGFDQFKPITIVIGRNNSGKSRLLDLVETLTVKPLNKLGMNVKCEAILSDNFLEHCFSKKQRTGRNKEE